jgi:hypothetical protein
MLLKKSDCIFGAHTKIAADKCNIFLIFQQAILYET